MNFEFRLRVCFSSLDFEFGFQIWFRGSTSSFDFEFRFRNSSFDFEFRLRVLISSFDFEFGFWVSTSSFHLEFQFRALILDFEFRLQNKNFIPDHWNFDYKNRFYYNFEILGKNRNFGIIYSTILAKIKILVKNLNFCYRNFGYKSKFWNGIWNGIFG